MKRMQMLRACIVALAIGGAVVSKAGTKSGITYVTLNDSGQFCDQEDHACGNNGGICSTGVTPNKRTYYHLNEFDECQTPLKMP